MATTDSTTRPRRHRGAKITALVVAISLVVVGLAVYFGQRALIYFPDRTNPGPVGRYIPNGEDVQFTTEDGLTLSTWLVTPAVDRGAAVLFLPGNAGNRAGRLGAATALADLGFTVLLLEYRGYGGNPGTPSQTGLARDARAAVAYLHQLGFAADRLLYVGESLGTGVATQLARTDPPAGIVLRSPFTSLVAVGQALMPMLPVSLILRDRYDTLANLPYLPMPITVLSGSADTTVPPAQSAAVAAAAVNLFSYIEVPGVDHNDPLWQSPYLADPVNALAESVLTP